MRPREFFTLLARVLAVAWLLALAAGGVALGTRAGASPGTGRTVLLAGGALLAGAMAAYGLGVLALWGNHRWRNTIVLRALVAGTIPFGSLVFVRWADKRRRRELSGDWRLGRNGSYAYSLPERIVAWATRNPWLAALSAAVIVGAAAALVVWGGPRLTWTR